MLRPAIDIDDLIVTIHSAALAEDGWTTIGNDLCRLLCADSFSLVKPSGRVSIKPWVRLFRLDAVSMTAYAEYWERHDVWYERALRNGRIGVGLINVDSQLMDCRECKKTAFYNEYLRRINVDRMMNICLSTPEQDGSYGPVAMSFYRDTGKEPFSFQESEILNRLTPHLTVAFENFWAAQSLRLIGRAYRNAVDTVTSAVFGIDPMGRVGFANRTGEEQIRQGRWLHVRGGILVPGKGVAEANYFAKALYRLLTGTSFKLLLTDGSTRAQAIASGAPISQTEANPCPMSPSALVWLTPILADKDVASELATLSGLSVAETRLVARLIAGEDLKPNFHTPSAQPRLVSTIREILSATSRMRRAPTTGSCGR
jgi:hypothetical protein